MGYGDILKCPQCKQVFDYSKGSRLQKHIMKHQSLEKVITFKQKEIQPMVSFFEQEFKKPLIRNIYFGFDFEALLIPNNKVLHTNKVGNATQHLINIHQPIAFVLQCNNSKYPLVKYSGTDAAQVFIAELNKLHDTLVQELKNELHIIYQKELSMFKRKYCKCSNKQLKYHKKKCEYNWKMKKIYDEYCQILILGFNSGKYDMTFIISHMLISSRPRKAYPPIRSPLCSKHALGFFSIH